MAVTRRRGNAFSTRQRRGAASPQKRDAFATQIGSHAGAWEPENQRLTNVNDTYV